MSQNEWDLIFSAREALLPPEAFLVENISLLKRGRLLDLACGDGRNIPFLLEYNYRITAVDFSDAALERVPADPRVRTFRRDLSSPAALEGFAAFDTILINHFVPPAQVLRELQSLLVPGGTLCWVAFSPRMAELRPDRLDYILDLDGLEPILPRLTRVRCDSWSEDGLHLNGCILLKSPLAA